MLRKPAYGELRPSRILQLRLPERHTVSAEGGLGAVAPDRRRCCGSHTTDAR